CFAGTAAAFGFTRGFLGLAAGSAAPAADTLPGAAGGISKNVRRTIAAARRIPTLFIQPRGLTLAQSPAALRPGARGGNAAVRHRRLCAHGKAPCCRHSAEVANAPSRGLR